MICRSLRFAKKQVFHISLFWIGWALLCWLKRWYLWRDILIKLKRDSVWLTFTNLTLLKPLGLKVLPISSILRTWTSNLPPLKSQLSYTGKSPPVLRHSRAKISWVPDTSVTYFVLHSLNQYTDETKQCMPV